MYKNGTKVEVTDDPGSRAELARFGWKENPPLKMPKSKAKDSAEYSDTKG